jgi:hypothetical protein
VLIAEMIELSVEPAHGEHPAAGPRHVALLDEHAPFRHVMERVNRVLMGGASDPRARVRRRSSQAPSQVPSSTRSSWSSTTRPCAPSC